MNSEAFLFCVRRLMLLGFVTVALSGCVSQKTYRANPSALVVPPEPKPPLPSMLRATLPVATSDCLSPSNPKRITSFRDTDGKLNSGYTRPCIAFIEYDDRGHRTVPATPSSRGQLDRATELIRKAVHDDPQHQPIILAFIHGWKHNDSPGSEANVRSGDGPDDRIGPIEDTNVQGFEHALNDLATNPKMYGGDDCRKSSAPCAIKPGHVVVGIYIAWRGESVSHYWPVARTISVYSRAGAADTVGTQDLVADLKQISETAHPSSPADPDRQPKLILIGHSFGGRVLENAINGLYMVNLTARSLAAEPSSIPTFADLVVYINSAAPASLALPMLNSLANQGLEYRQDDPNLPRHNGKGSDRPLFLSLTTPGDSATGFLFPIAFEAQAAFENALQEGELKKPDTVECFDPKSETVTPNSTRTVGYFRATSAAHADLLQSHILQDLGPPKNVGDPSSCPMAESPDIRWVPGHCFLVAPKPSRCNNTPYWIMNTDSTIIPDHGTIFTERLIRFIGPFLPQATSTLISTPTLSTNQSRSAFAARSATR